ncbi:hypothetical protein B0H21DRAFT_701557 [Amylocystis lapponica]|nr:hypothetical protein B0H21DRAFT_701557 [Amylocystis lapponica]
MFLLDMLDNMPRLRLSTDHIKFVLWILRELRVDGVPSFKAFRKMQAKSSTLTNIQTHLHWSPIGNVFYQNSVPNLLALDWANPETRPYIEEYPIRSQTVSESYHSRKWTHEIDAELQAPMWAAHHSRKHYFLGEMAALSDGRRVVPLAWFRYCSHGEVC